MISHRCFSASQVGGIHIGRAKTRSYEPYPETTFQKKQESLDGMGWLYTNSIVFKDVNRSQPDP